MFNKIILFLVLSFIFSFNLKATDTSSRYCNYNSIDSAKEQKKYRFRTTASTTYSRATFFIEKKETEKAIKILKKMLNSKLTPYEISKVNETLAILSFRNNDKNKTINYYEKSLNADGLVFEDKIELMLKVSQIYFTYGEIEKGYNSLLSLNKIISESNCKIEKRNNVFKKIKEITKKDLKDFSSSDYKWLILQNSKIADLQNKELKIIYRYPPAYPMSARYSKVEGWVLLEFDVNKKGQAINIRMIDHEPKGKIFKENSIKALKRWKFDPAVVDGEKVITKSVKHVFTFSLTDN